jgi:hypothetical protein
MEQPRSYSIKIKFNTSEKCVITYDIGNIKIIIYTSHKQLKKHYNVTSDEITATLIKKIKQDNKIKNETIVDYQTKKTSNIINGFLISEEEGQFFIEEIATGNKVQIASFKIKNKWKFRKKDFDKLIIERNDERTGEMDKIKSILLSRKNTVE